MSRCAHGTSPVKRCRNSAAVIAPAPRSAVELTMSRVAALDHLRVLLVQRHPPDDLARALAGGVDLARPLLVGGEQARVGAAEATTIAPVERRQVHQALGAEVDRVGEAVGQHEPALGVGVVDLDRHAGLGAHDVARASSRGRTGRFSVAPITPDDAHRQLQRRDRAHGLQHGGAAAHVELHLVHLRRGLDRDPAGVERHGLADEAEQRPGDVGRLVAQRDQPRLLVASRARRPRTRPSRRPRCPRGRAPRRSRPAAPRALASADGVSTFAGRSADRARR